MKAHGKGAGISINTSYVNAFKMEMTGANGKPLPVREFKPLQVKPHPQQARIDAFNAIPSKWTK